MSDPALPVLETDLFGDEAISDPYPIYRHLRDLGSVVLLAPQGLPAVGRYDDVRAVLAGHDTFVSGHGVLWNDVANTLTRGTTLASDPPEHTALRKLVAGRLTPRALRDERPRVEAIADEVVDRVLARDGVIDGVTDLAHAMPSAVVPDFLGFPDDCRPHLLTWARGAIEAGGPVTARTAAAVPIAQHLGAYAESLVTERRALPGSLGAGLLEAADRGEIARDRCTALMLDYFGPSMETTLTAIGNAIALFAAHPGQWQLLRDDPSLMTKAFNEVVRLETPLRAFTRVTAHDTTIGTTHLPKGTRLAVFFASANRDERRWTAPDRFDITRHNADHVGLGLGEHGCAGQGLARLEFAALFTRLARRVERFEPAGDFVLTRSSLLRSYATLPIRLIPAT